MTTLKNKKGVSLVELIAVIVIMGIIATVGGVAVASIIENSNKSAAVTAVSDVFAAGKNYLQQNYTYDEDKKGDNGRQVSLATLANGYLEAATVKKFEGKTILVTVDSTGVTYSISEGDKLNQIESGKYTVYYVDGEFTTTAPSKAPANE